MRFPGRRKSKHYFPVSENGRIPFDYDFDRKDSTYIVGIDQLLVDIEIHVEDSFLESINVPKGESVVCPTDMMDKLYRELKKEGKIKGEFAGGSIGNTLHNYSILTDNQSFVLGAITKNISVGDDAFKYIRTTNDHVDFSHLMPVDGPMGRAFCFVTQDGERTFVISKGIMNDLEPLFVSEELVAGASALLISTYLLRDNTTPIFQSTLKAVKAAKEFNVPVVLSLGTSFVVKEQRDFLRQFIADYVTVLAGNENECECLTGESDVLLCAEKLLDLCDMALITVGARGLYLCGHVDEAHARRTEDQIHSKSIPEYNLNEYSRTMMKRDCQNPIKIYTHINPFMGGPKVIMNTNGAGDAALAALLHDMAANNYHRQRVPNSPKHAQRYLTYSSIHQISKYCNRVSFEVLKQNSPRLSRCLPEREECLEESYWAK
jgi:inosine kinase